jgi:RimJ/RimL family protein N-acetyltransferase
MTTTGHSDETQRLLDSAPIKGRYVTLEAFQPSHHVTSLWEHLNAGAGISTLFRWLPMSVPHDAASLGMLLENLRAQRGFAIFAIVGDPGHLNPSPQQQQQGQPGGREKAESPPHRQRETLGVIAYLNIHPPHRELEVGMVVFGPALQRTCAATEVHYLLLRNALEIHSASPQQHLPYTRIAYKCNALNVASRRAAERLGYAYEGRWRKHMIFDGKSRDSDWLSIIDDDWAVVKKALEEWLGDGNFDGEGRQRRTLESFRQGSQ